MTSKSNQIVFFGSGPVAAAALKLLVRDFEVEAVITKPVPAHHTGSFPVIETTRQLGLRTLTPANKKELSELFAGKPVTSRIGVVIDYGIIISPDVIDYFPLGIVNSHFSLLPRWRGADPISFAILAGDAETGVSLMLVAEALDEGPILAQEKLLIKPESTTPSLTNELIELSHKMLVAYLSKYVAGQIKPVPQSGKPTYSRKLAKNDGLIDWNKPAERIEREIRAFIEWPRSRTKLGQVDVIITKAHAVGTNHPDLKPGDIIIEQGIIIVECSKGYLCIDKLQPTGKKEMSAKEFLAGYMTRLQI